MLDNRPEADRILVARLTGTAKRHARWRNLSDAENAAGVAELRELADGRGDLLAEVAGLLEGASEGELDEPLSRQAARSYAARPGQTRGRSLARPGRGGAGGLP